MSWTKKTVNDMLTMVESLTLPDSEGANVTLVNTSNITSDINNKKLIVRLAVTEKCTGDGALDCRVQGSIDGTNWTNVLTTLSMDIDPTALNSAMAIADLSAYFAPYWRIQVFSDGTDTVDDATVQVSLAVG